LDKIRNLLAKASYDQVEQEAVFGRNARRVFGF
jgi:hypothetical protein